MPKRKASESKEDRWVRKMKKYEEKLSRRQRRRHPSTSSDDEDYLQDGNPAIVQSPTELPDPEMEIEIVELAEEPPGLAEPAEPAEPGATETIAAPQSPLPTLAPGSSTTTAGNPVPSTSGTVPTDGDVAPSAPETVVDPELLEALGVFIADTPEWGEDINGDLAKRWEPILKNGLKKEVRDEITKTVLPPKNCPSIKAPHLNPEVCTLLIESAKNRDARVFKKQAQLGCALSILGTVMTNMLTKSTNTADHLRLLSDATKLIADSHFAETETRRSLLIPRLDKGFVEPFKDRKRDNFLFGEKLAEFIKLSQGIRRTGQIIQSTSASSSNNLNWRGPSQPSTSRAPAARPHRFSRANTSRGGQRSAYHPAGTSRRQPPPPPPPQRARQPPPPPPAPQRRHQVANYPQNRQ